MHVIKHSRDVSGARCFSVVGADLVRLHIVAARLDLLPHRCRRVHWRAVWLPDRGIWQIAYLMKGRRLSDLDEFERQYYVARRAVQSVEFPGFKWYAGVSAWKGVHKKQKSSRKARVLRPAE